MSEMMMMNSVLTRVIAAFDFLGYVFIVFMFITAIWKPNRIYSYSAFRYSLLLFAGTLAVPATVDMIWNAYNLISQTKTPTTNFGRSTPNEAQTMMLSSAIAANIARILMGSSVAVGILSLIDPDRRRREGMTLPSAGPMPRPETPPQPHPLDRPAVVRQPATTPQIDPATPIPLAASSQPAAQARTIPQARPAAPQPRPPQLPQA
jgi:hypothetical protein